DRATAANHQLDALALSLELGATRDVAFAIIVAARLAGSTEYWATAVRLQTAADVALASIGVTLYPSDRVLCDELLASAARHLLDSDTIRQDEHGQSVSIADAVNEARDVLLATAASNTSAERGRSPTSI